VADKKHYVGEFKELKEDGTGKAIFATMDVVDKDGDITIPGAFGEQTVKLVGGHDWKSPNIGMAKIKEVDGKAVADFKFYLEMESAQEWYKAVRANYENDVEQQYSYGFHVKDAAKREQDGKKIRELKSLEVFEVSFVMSGAGQGTQTLGIKCESCEAKEFDAAAPTTKAATPEDPPTAPAQDPPADPDPTPAAKDGAAETKMYIDKALEGSWEYQQMALRDKLRTEYTCGPDCKSHAKGKCPERWAALMATYPGRCVFCIEDYSGDKGGKTYHEADWEIGEDGDVVLSNIKDVELEVTIRTVSTGRTRNMVRSSTEAEAKRAMGVYTKDVKEGRTLSAASRTRLSKLARSLNDLGSIRDGVAGDIQKFLDETDPANQEKAYAALWGAVADSSAALGRATNALSQ